jgi:ribosome maturation protein Sdo1
MLTWTHRHGSQGVLDGASKASLENEFGTANVEECVRKILEGGELQGYTVC